MQRVFSLVLVLGSACATSPAADLAAARALFDRNIQAIQQKDREGYLACYRADDRLIRSGPGGPKLGYAELAASTSTVPASWPESLEAHDVQVHAVAPGCVYGSYRYRVVFDGAASEGISERVFVERDGRWEIAVSTAFGRAASNDPRLERVAFLAGDWVHAEGGRTTEESWSHAHAGSMIGTARTFAGGETVHWEHLRIELEGDDIYYVATPKDQATARFRLAAHGPGTATFENPAHDFPQRITYRLEDGRLHARVEGGGKSAEWTFTRR